MKKIYLILSFLISFHGNTESKASILPKQLICDEVDLTKLIEYRFDYKCLQVAFNRNNSCAMSKVLQSRSIPLQIISVRSLRYRDIRSVTQTACQTFLVFAKNINVINEIINSDQSNKKQFFPFTRIYFYFFEGSHRNETINLESMTVAKNFLTANALFGYLFEQTKDANASKVVIRDLLTNEINESNSSHSPSDLLHPMVDTRLTKDNFTISLYNCEPYTVYPETADDNTIINQMDGIEFRFVKDLTKNWKKNYNFRDFSRTKIPPYSGIMNDLSNKTSDMAMCSIWLIEKYYRGYDMTTFYDQQCSTFLVPKPKKLNEASAIYKALHTSVWLLFLLFFLCSSILLNLIAKIEKRLYEVDSLYIDFTRAIMETVNTATSHSALRFQSGQTSVKILLTSWILLCVWMGISYTTIYTSRLASPSYEEPINTVKQFVHNGLYICNAYFQADPMQVFRSSVNKDYRELSTRSLVYGDNLMFRRQLILDGKCGMFMTRSMKNYVSVKVMKDGMDLLPKLRMMQECVSLYYTGFAFQKYSPYQECGIIQKWYLDASRNQKRLKTIFEDYPQRDSHRQINLINVSGAFIVLFTGLLLSSLTFFVEFIKHRRMRKQYQTIK